MSKNGMNYMLEQARKQQKVKFVIQNIVIFFGNSNEINFHHINQLFVAFG